MNDLQTLPACAPSIGERVLYHPSVSDGLYRHQGKPLAALVCAVWSEALVNLAVFDVSGGLNSRTSVPYIVPEPGKEAPATGGYAEPIALLLGEVVTLDAPAFEDTPVPSKVSAERIELLMASVAVYVTQVPGTTRLMAAAHLPDGFSLATVCSGTISSENFDYAVGEQIVREKVLRLARDKLWELEGYLLRDRLARSQAAPGFEGATLIISAAAK